MSQEQHEPEPSVSITMTWDEFLEMIQPDLDKVNSFTAKAHAGDTIPEDDFFDAVRGVQSLRGFLEMVPVGEVHDRLTGVMESWDGLSRRFNFIIE